MMTATARPESPRAADALHKIAAAAASVGGGDENASTNANKPPTKKPKEAPKQQPSESDENDEEEDDEEEEDEEEDTKPKVSSSTKEDKQNTTEDDKKTSKKSRRELPPHTVAILKGWMLSPEHVKHPYPTDEDKQMLLKKTGINMKQLTNWFTNARKRIWKPMMRREHSRQLQSAMEFEKARGGPNAYPMAPPPNMPPYAREGAYPPRAAIRHSFDAGSLGGPPRDPMGYGHPYNAPPPPQAYPPPAAHAYPPRTVRSVSESATRHEMDDYIDAMRIRKRVHEMGPETMETDSKRFRRGAVLSPRCLQILHEWVAANRHMEYPTPGDSDKLQLSRDTGLDVQQIELWFKTNVGRYGALLQPPPQSAASAAMQHPAYRSIPSRDNPMYPPPPAYGERRSIPSQGNPMFPSRPAVRSSIPGAGNPQFPPPPAVRRDGSDGFRGGMQPPGYPGGGVYPPPPHQGYEADGSRPMRTMSVNSGQYPPTSGAPMPTIPAPVGAPGLPSLTGRPVPGARPGPPMGQARDSRSHTLDMGQFADARRRKMNFQDILASTSAPQIPSQLQAQAVRPTSGNGAPFDTSRLPTAENLYPAKAVSPYAQQARGGGSTSSNASNADPQGPGSRI